MKVTTKGVIGLFIITFLFVAVATCEYEEYMERENAVQENIKRHHPDNNLLNYAYRDYP